MEKRYGLLTAISMVVGIVIGSGVFIKASKVLMLTGGNMFKSVAVIAIVGAIMIVCSLVFAELGGRYEKVNGVVDYAEMALGPNYAYYVGWFLAVIYYPCLVAILGWFASLFTCLLFNIEFFSGAHLAIGAMFVMFGYGINALSPKLGGRLQVSMTVIKLIPLLLMGIGGTIAGLVNGTTLDVLHTVTDTVGGSSGGGMIAAVCAFAFSYEGWIIATSINAELKNAKRNLPIALVIGAVICTAVYCLYVFSMSSVGSVDAILDSGMMGVYLPRIAFSNLFGTVAGTVVYVFIIISCLGTMNGLIMGSCRGIYSVAVRNMGPNPEFFGDVDRQNNMCIKSSLVGMMLGGFWYFYTHVCWWCGNPDCFGTLNLPWWFNWEVDEISICSLYAMYIPMFIALMVKGKELGFFKRFVLPSLAVIASGFMVYCCYYAYRAHGQFWYYLIFFALVLFAGYLFHRFGGKKKPR